MRFRIAVAILSLFFCLWQLTGGLPGWDVIYHGAMTQWVAENGIQGYVTHYEEQYSYPPGLHLLGSFFVQSGLEPSVISYFIGCLLLSLLILSWKNGWVLAVSRPTYNLLFGGFIPNSIGLLFFSLIHKTEQAIPILFAGVFLISPTSALGIVILSLFQPKLRKGVLIGLLLSAPWILTNLSDFTKFSDHTSLKISDIPELFHLALLVFLPGLFFGKNILPIWTFFILSFNPLPGLWDRLIYFSFLLAAEKFNFKLAIPILIFSLVSAPVVVQDWSLLRWGRENLVGKSLADPALRPSLLSVSQIPVFHGLGWRDENQYQDFINCVKTDPPVSSIIMENPCKQYLGWDLAYSGVHKVLVTTT
jgi:hypothetical protein